MNEEVWKVIPGHTRYEASTLGRIRDLKDGEIKNPLLNGGFWCFNIIDDEGKKYLGKVHRLVAATFLPNPNNYNRVQHKGSRDDNSVSNIEWLVPKPKPSRVERAIEYVKWKGICFDKELFADMCSLKVWQLTRKLKEYTPAEIVIDFKPFKGIGIQYDNHWFPSLEGLRRYKWKQEIYRREKVKEEREKEKEFKIKPKKYGVGVFENYPIQGIIDRVIQPVYISWDAMLSRCYNPNNDSAKNYGDRGVKAVEAWLIFQEYAIWYNSTYKELGWHVDKDILVEGNMTYGPDTCVFVPPAVNTFFATLPKQEGSFGYYKNKNLYTTSVSFDGKKKYYSFKTETEAQQKYIQLKQDAARLLADKYPNMDNRVKLKLTSIYS